MYYFEQLIPDCADLIEQTVHPEKKMNMKILMIYHILTTLRSTFILYIFDISKFFLINNSYTLKRTAKFLNSMNIQKH